jgi:Domain of unknown function (DUF4160)
VPTVLRFRGFHVMIFTLDHAPPHVHAFGAESQVSFWLNAPAGPVSVRAKYGLKLKDQRALMAFLNDNLDILLKRWNELHGKR